MRRFLSLLLGLTGLCGLVASSAAGAEVTAKRVEYKQGSTALEGVLFVDSGVQGKRPGVLLAHEQGATSAIARTKSELLARMGYLVFSIDLYGKGNAPKNAQDSLAKLELMGTDRTLVRERTAAAREQLEKFSQLDAKRIGAVGFGAGGTAILELARAKADLKGAICVHGDLTPTGSDGKSVGAALLIVMGADDPKIPLSQVAAFEEEMRQGDVDWQLIRFGGVGGDFTNPQAGRNLKSGRAYDPDADQRTNNAIKLFLGETFHVGAKPAPNAAKPMAPPKPAATASGVPEKALKVLEYVDKNGEAMNGYEGGRNFGNFERRLPQSASNGQRIRYREWDVNPLRQGVNRGAERLVTGSDGSAHYTNDHYASFKKIR
jgi:dienelactone hydrolase